MRLRLEALRQLRRLLEPESPQLKWFPQQLLELPLPLRVLRLLSWALVLLAQDPLMVLLLRLLAQNLQRELPL